MKIIIKSLKIIGILLFTLSILIVILALYNQYALKVERDKIIPNGQLINVGSYNIHVYSEGKNDTAPTLVLLSGSATVAPVYDFKPLYSLLSDEYRVAIVEKAGYGYSDIVEVNRDVATMVDEVKTALVTANIKAPYILLPHSMSGLEAIYWAQNFPDDVAGIIGLDMAVPDSYEDFDFNKVNQKVTWGNISVKLGLLRIPGIYPLSKANLSKEELEQQKLLMYRNAVNPVYIEEEQEVYSNAQIIKSGQPLSCPMVMFSSDGTEIGDDWILAQERYAKENNIKQIVYNCGHYLHYYKSHELADEIKAFIQEIQ